MYIYIYMFYSYLVAASLAVCVVAAMFVTFCFMMHMCAWSLVVYLRCWYLMYYGVIVFVTLFSFVFVVVLL